MNQNLKGLWEKPWYGVYPAEVALVVRPELAGLATGGSLFFTFCGVLIGLPIFSLLVDFTGSYSIGYLCTGLVVIDLWDCTVFFEAGLI